LKSLFSQAFSGFTSSALFKTSSIIKTEIFMKKLTKNQIKNNERLRLLKLLEANKKEVISLNYQN